MFPCWVDECQFLGKKETFYQITGRHIPEDHNIDTHYCKNFTCKSSIRICVIDFRILTCTERFIELKVRKRLSGFPQYTK
jgi:hypothetical protein